MTPRPAWPVQRPAHQHFPKWLARVALADSCSTAVLVLAAASAGVELSRSEAATSLAVLEADGCLEESGAGSPRVGGVLRADAREVMLAELELVEQGVDGVRRELLAAGLDLPDGDLGPQLARWALELGDWTGLEAVWRTHASADLITDPPTRAGYAGVPPEVRARFPGLSFAQALASAYDPQADLIDLGRMTAALVRDGRALHSDWPRRRTAEAQVLAGTIRMLALATAPEAAEDRSRAGAAATYAEVSRVISAAAVSGEAVTGKASSFFHATAAMVAMQRGDWSLARRQGELSMIVSDHCSFPSFLAALVVASSSVVSGSIRPFGIAEAFLAEHAAHRCRAAAWIEPGFHLIRAEAAVRQLDRELAAHHLKLFAGHLSFHGRLDVQPLHALVLSTVAILWEDPERGLAQFDSLVGDAGYEPEVGNPWWPVLLRCRVQLLLSLGAVHRAGQVVGGLLPSASSALSAMPAAWFYLFSGDFARAVAKADEGIFDREVSLVDRGFLYAARSAALHRAGAAEASVASASAAACVVCEQAGTLVPFAALPTQERDYLVAEHERHHGDPDCLISRAARRGSFAGLRRSSAATAALVRLTRREEVLLPLLATSATVPEIASQLFVSVNTVRKQVVALREKLGVASRSDLIRRAHQLGLLADRRARSPHRTTDPAEPDRRA